MAIEKSFQTRIIHKHDIEDNWNKATNFKPNKGEMIVYDKDDNHNFVRLKFGDGETVVKDLPFIQTSSSDARDIYNPNKTYFIYGGTNVPSSNAAGEEWTFRAGVVIDWGDGSSQTAVANVKNEHTYTDGVEYHLIAISGLTAIPTKCFYDDTSIIEAYISTRAPYMTIDVSAFENAVGLKKIRFSNKVTELAGMAFLHCTSLETMIFEGTTAPTLGLPEPIPNTIKKIFVPKTAVSAYQTATNWSVYADKIVYEIDSSDLSDYVKAIIVTSETYLYAANREGPNAKIRLDINASQFTVAERYSDGRLAVGYPIADDDAVHKKYAEDNFVKAIIAPAGQQLVYIASPDNPNDKVYMSLDKTGHTIPRRKENGSIEVGSPVADDDAVNKQYFEQHKADLARYVSTSLLGG